MEVINEFYADSVEFRYVGTRPIITGAYIKCRTGDIVGLLGRNGAGKSTLLKILFGSIKAQHSHILINGKRSTKPYLSGKVGYLPQDSFLPSNEKVFKLIKLLVLNEAEQHALSNDSGITPLISKRVYQLSGGERRYLEICLLLYQPTDFLLLDEPFTGLEPLAIQRISDLIAKFADTKGFIISDHNYRDVLAIATETLLLQNGSCRRIAAPKELEFFYLPESPDDLQGDR
ncbi:ATP-binding cassette domain-containing protein [Sphingobacterium bambusae]|uniref:ATP-binding cassette domain-containing protein n=1 Tax=Sphingobacterium bambusae TaxID=662858 RepID=A0ABW6BMV8_9SPHI|nr:ATP-binding cassette domain-containing protein [Sphingobacterium bambusae]WPL48028.1 ATP-binding cassette domain-containing protein [Sphingobacterium bambusae]